MLEKLAPDHPLLLVGCGNMGGALASGWLSAGLSPAALKVVDPALAGGSEKFPGVECFETLEDVGAAVQPAAIIVAVKPQMVPAILPGLGQWRDSGVPLVSIAAGTRIAVFRQVMGADAPVIRAMPNTPAAIGKGISAIFADTTASDEEKALAEALFSCVGEVVWLSREEDLDTVTAVSGSGPAYFFLLAEELARAANELGLDSEVANRLAAATLIGAGALLAESGEEPAALRQKVTSPKGTTEAAVGQLCADSAFAELIGRAVRAAAARSEELSR